MGSEPPKPAQTSRLVRAIALSALLAGSACTADASLSGTTAAPPSTTTTVDSASPVPTLATPGEASNSPTSVFEPETCFAPVTGIPQTGVALPIPAEFYLADNFTGIFHDATLASVVAAELPVRLSEEMSIGQYVDRLESEQGVNVTEYHSDEVAGYPATRVRAWQVQQGVRVERWLVIAESSDRTLILTAQVPASEPQDALDELLEVLECAVWTPGEVHDFADGPPFTIEPVAPFEDRSSLMGSLLLDGGDGALFIVAPAIAPPSGDRGDTAHTLFESLGPQGGGSLDAEPEVTSGPEPVTIDSLDGFRIDGHGSIEGEAFTVLQIVLFGDDDGYWRMLALIPSDRAEDLLSAAERMFRSFHRN